MKPELVKPDYLSELLVEPRPMYRIDVGTGRHYYYYKDGEPVAVASVTNVIKNTTPTPQAIIEYIAKHGIDEANRRLIESSSYGTFLHIECGRVLIDGFYDFLLLTVRLRQYLKENNLSSIYMDWLTGKNDNGRNYDNLNIKKDIQAFMQFVRDYNVKPLAIEIILASQHGFGGAIDLPCELDVEDKGFWGEVYKSGDRKGQPKETKKTIRVRSIIDLKSGRKGFWDTQEMQLHMYKTMWDENYPDMPIDRLYNWSPKNWRDGSVPSYNFKDQTDSKHVSKIPHMIELFKCGVGDVLDKKMMFNKEKVELYSDEPLFTVKTLREHLKDEYDGAETSKDIL
jgi:hypothetical protein